MFVLVGISVAMRAATGVAEPEGGDALTASSGTPPGFLRHVGRTALLLAEWLFIVPGAIDLILAGRDPLRRTWSDRATHTIVTKDRTPTTALGLAATSHQVPTAEPWQALVTEATAASARLDRAVASVAPGPLRDRLEEVRTRVDACVRECIGAAVRGAELAAIAAGVPSRSCSDPCRARGSPGTRQTGR